MIANAVSPSLAVIGKGRSNGAFPDFSFTEKKLQLNYNNKYFGALHLFTFCDFGDYQDFGALHLSNTVKIQFHLLDIRLNHNKNCVDRCNAPKYLQHLTIGFIGAAHQNICSTCPSVLQVQRTKIFAAPDHRFYKCSAPKYLQHLTIVFTSAAHQIFAAPDHRFYKCSAPKYLQHLTIGFTSAAHQIFAAPDHRFYKCSAPNICST